MFGPKIKLDKELYEKLKKFAEISGYSSVDEFIMHILEKEVSKMDDEGASDEEIKKKLEGLGYIS
jgi:metal-responsive CopG/Arc/MetJ family transcriptional regulator